MRACFYHFMNAELYPSLQTNQIKASYVFFKQTITIGDIYFRVYHEEIMNKFSARLKVRYMLNHYKSAPEDEWDRDEIKLLEDLDNMFNLIEKMKHKPQQMLGKLKKMEPMIEDMFKDIKIIVRKNLTEMGFDTLKGIINHPELVLFDLKLDKPEVKIKEAAYSVILSDAIQLKLPSFDDGHDVHVVGEAYFEITFNDATRFSTSQFDTTAYSSENNYLQCIFKFIPLANFTSSELKLLRNYFENPATILNEKMEEYINLFQNSEVTFEDRKIFINNEIMPIGQNIQAKINDQELFKFLDDTKYISRSYIKVFVGETTIKNLWNYYKFIKIIQDITWNKLEKLIADNTVDPEKRIPIIAYNLVTLDEDYPDETQQSSETSKVEIKSVKKAIQLDDF